MTDSDKSRLQLRAKRFGLDGDDEKLKSRAARFGTEPSSNANSLKSNEKMKQRAERFGHPVPVIKKDDEKRSQRQARVGDSGEKLAKRAARFAVSA